MTAPAEAWLPHASEALTLLQQSAQDIFSTRAQRLTIVASASITRCWLMPRLPKLEAKASLNFKTLMVEADEAPGRGIAVVRYGAGVWPGLRVAQLFDEELAPVATPALLASGDAAALPRIHVTGPRASWSDWDGAALSSATILRVDSMGAGIAAAEAGAGLLLASLPLCGDVLAAGRLMRAGADSLRPGTAPWLTARPQDITQRQWGALTAAFCAD
jgi:LysR family glycine cleavage system transcriptional activator